MNKVISLMIDVARAVGFQSLAEGLSKGATLTEFDSVAKEDILTALNQTQDHLALVAFPFYDTKSVSVEGGEYNLLRLPERFFRVESVSENGIPLTFSVMGTTLYVSSGVRTVRYRCIPPRLTEDGEYDFEPHAMERALVYGAACEFCLKNGRFSDAWNWQRAYELEISALSRCVPPKGGVIAPREWA